MNYQGTQTVALRVYFYPILDFLKEKNLKNQALK